MTLEAPTFIALLPDKLQGRRTHICIVFSDAPFPSWRTDCDGPLHESNYYGTYEGGTSSSLTTTGRVAKDVPSGRPSRRRTRLALASFRDPPRRTSLRQEIVLPRSIEPRKRSVSSRIQSSGFLVEYKKLEEDKATRTHPLTLQMVQWQWANGRYTYSRVPGSAPMEMMVPWICKSDRAHATDTSLVEQCHVGRLFFKCFNIVVGFRWSDGGFQFC